MRRSSFFNIILILAAFVMFSCGPGNRKTQKPAGETAPVTTGTVTHDTINKKVEIIHHGNNPATDSIKEEKNRKKK